MAIPAGLAASYAALAQQGSVYDDADSPTDRYYAFLAEIEVVAASKGTPLQWSAQFELVPFEWMEAAVLSQPDTIRTPPPPSPYSLLVFEQAAPDEIAKALGTTPDDIAEGDWFIITLGRGSRAGRVIPRSRPVIQPIKATGRRAPPPMQIKLRLRFTSRSLFSAKAVAALVAMAVPREIGVMDVGQGSCNLIYDVAGAPLFYVDLGLPMFFHNASRPPVNGAGNIGILNPGPCLAGNPPVFITHWHWDHYAMATWSANWAALCNRDWVVSGQPAGPAANFVIGDVNASANGNVIVIPAGFGHLVGGFVTVIQCVPGPGVAADLNNTGIAVLVRINDLYQRVALLSGDAAFQSIPGLAAVAGLKWMATTHHGSDTNLIPAPPSPIPAPYAANQGRLAYSYGINGAAAGGAHCYGHPAANAVAAYPPAGWGNALLVESTAETGPNSGVAGRGNILMGSNVIPPVCGVPNCPFHVFPKTLV